MANFRLVLNSIESLYLFFENFPAIKIIWYVVNNSIPISLNPLKIQKFCENKTRLGSSFKNVVLFANIAANLSVQYWFSMNKILYS